MAASTLMGISLCGGSNIRHRTHFLHVKMGQNYTKYCHVSSMLKYPVDSFNETSARREELHGKADFTLIGKFQPPSFETEAVQW